MADLEDLDLITPADSLYAGGLKINLIRTRVDALYTVLSDITAAEADQVENIATTTISAAQWAYVGALNQELTTTSTVTFGTINAFTLGGKLTAGAVEIEGSAFDINGGTIDGITALTAAGALDIGAYGLTALSLTADGLTATRVVYAGAGGLLSGAAELTWSKPTLAIVAQSETAAGNAFWIDLRSTVTSGDLTGIRSRVYGNAASAGANVRGGYFEAKMAAASKKAAMLEGALFHADYSPGSITVSGDVRGFTAHISQGAGLNAANLFGGLINIQTRGDETITTDDIGLMIRNEAVGGVGRTMDAGLKITDLNMGGGTNGFGYGIDLNGVGIATADIRFSGGQVITSSASLLTLPAIALTDVTMSLGSDADGDIYYRASNVLTRLAKGTATHVLTMGAAIPEWAAATGGLENIVEDTTPQLGGDLDANDHAILENVTAKTTTATLTVAEAGTITVSAGSAYTITLPTASGYTGLTYHFIKTDANYNLITLDGDGGETFNYPNTAGAAQTTYPRLNTYGAEVTIVSDGTNWQCINERLGLVPACWVYLGADQTGIESTTGVLVELDTESYDIGSNFNTTTHKFIVPIPGDYSMEGQIRYAITNLVADKAYDVVLYNGETEIGLFIGHASYVGVLTTYINVLEKSASISDEFTLVAYHDAGVDTIVADGGATNKAYTYMRIKLDAKT